MNKPALLPLESYRLAQYAVPIPCYICGGDNALDAELCRHCQAPMALAHQAGSESRGPQMLAALGSVGAGKTVYLGMLMDLLSRETSRIQALARGAFSISLQQHTMAALARCEFPTKTPNEPDRWNWVHCQVRTERRRQPIDLIMPDMAGEALIEEVEHPNTYPVIHAFLSRCAGVLVLIDAASVDEGRKEHVFFSMKLLSYLSELGGGPRRRRAPRPVAMVFTKADECEACFDDPAQFARERAPGVWQHCQQRFPQHRFFATGVVGACAQRSDYSEGRVRIPLRIEPRGVVEPFEWMIGQLKGR